MMAALWSDIDADLRSATKHFGRAVELYRSERFAAATTPDYLDEMAFLHAMQSGYTSFEAGLKRLFALLDEDLPKGGDAHAALLRRARRALGNERPAILAEPLYRAADELRRFRHVAIHSYDYLDIERAALAVKAAESFVKEIGPAMARFRAVIDPN